MSVLHKAVRWFASDSELKLTSSQWPAVSSILGPHLPVSPPSALRLCTCTLAYLLSLNQSAILSSALSSVWNALSSGICLAIPTHSCNLLSDLTDSVRPSLAAPFHLRSCLSSHGPRPLISCSMFHFCHCNLRHYTI